MRKVLLMALVITIADLAGMVLQTLAAESVGYTDTPMLPSGKWHVHDPNRPKPPVVTPAANFSDGAPAPSDAIVLFDGSDFSHWESDEGAPQWTINEGYMEVKRQTGPVRTNEAVNFRLHLERGTIHTKDKFGDCQLHLEFAEPEKVVGDSQGRGNSGVFLQGVYEVQILDCYNNPTYPDGECGAVYGQSPPLVNACKKPGQWQTYDIFFEAARWNEKHELVRPASVTVLQNGLLLHHKQAILGPTVNRALASYKKELPAEGPIALQNHGNPVRFRNIWIRNIQEEEKP
jgi:hypothetical protein